MEKHSQSDKSSNEIVFSPIGQNTIEPFGSEQIDQSSISVYYKNKNKKAVKYFSTDNTTAGVQRNIQTSRQTNSQTNQQSRNESNQSQENNPFRETKVQLRFIFRLYLTLSLQIAFNLLCLVISINNQSIINFVKSQNGTVFVYVSGVTTCIISLVIINWDYPKKSQMAKLMCILLFTVSEVLFVVQFSIQLDCRFMLVVFLISFTILAVLTIYTLFIKDRFKADFATAVGQISAICIGILLYQMDFQVQQVIVCTILMIFYSRFLSTETYQIVNHRKHKFEVDDYIIGIIMIYFDLLHIIYHIYCTIRDILIKFDKQSNDSNSNNNNNNNNDQYADTQQVQININ